jgi:hypothetical protein
MCGQSLKPIKWKLPPEADAVIRRAYQTVVGFSRRSVVKELAARYGVPRWKISRRACHLALTAKQRKEPDWSDRELKILERSAHLGPQVIQRHLKAKGFYRSESGIVMQRKRRRFLQNLHGYSANQVAQCFGIDNKSITRWIHLGYLKATKRGTGRTSRQGGDIYYIKNKSIRDFILEYLPLIDIRKVDKYWFVDLLVGKDQGVGPLSVAKDSRKNSRGCSDDYLVDDETTRAMSF